MSRIVRWDPFREMVTARTQADRILDQFLNSVSSWETEGNRLFQLALDVSENEDAFMVSAAVPGINPDDLDISFADNTLTIKGETHAPQQTEGHQYHLQERRFGQFMRTISLPTPINGDEIDAEFENGILTLTLPKADEVKSRRITVRSNGNSVVNG